MPWSSWFGGGDHRLARAASGGGGRCRSTSPGESDAQDIEEVTPVPSHQLEPAVAVVAPTDADFLHAVAAALGQVQDLDIEHVPVNPAARKQVARDVAAEELEPALGVVDGPQADHAVHADS